LINLQYFITYKFILNKQKNPRHLSAAGITIMQKETGKDKSEK
jgi:hypothetical protein